MAIDEIVKHLWAGDDFLRWWKSETYRGVSWYYAEDRKYLIRVDSPDGRRIGIVEARCPSDAIRKVLTPFEMHDLAYKQEANDGGEEG